MSDGEEVSAPSRATSSRPLRVPVDARDVGIGDRKRAVAALPDLLSKVGGGETARRQDGSDIVIEVLIPEARYDDFARSLEGLGVWNAPGLRQRVMLDSPYLHIPIRIAE